MTWIAVGAALLVAGGVLAVAAARKAPEDRASTAGGLVIGLGVGMALWGVVACVVGLIVLL